MEVGFKNTSVERGGPAISRRTALLAGAGLAVLGGTRQLSAQEATPGPDSGPTFLFVQLAESGSWTPKPDVEDVYELTLRGVGTQSLYFSDRPERIVGTVETDRFLDALGFTPANPPNAAAVVRTPEGERDVLVIELFNPVYTQEFNVDGGASLRYDARVLDAYSEDGLVSWYEEQDDRELPGEFSDISLFIDDCPDITTCYGIAPDAFDGQVPVGPLPTGPLGRCWDWEEFACVPCTGASMLFYSGVCNREYPEACAGKCWPEYYSGNCGSGGFPML